MAALTAVLYALDQHESCANLLRNTTLWQAIREQVVGGNGNESLELSITAASCLTRYVELMAEEETEEEEWQLSSGWLVLVTSRIQQVLPQVQQSPCTLVLMLLGQCLQCLVLLLENNPLVSTPTESNYADWLFPLLEASRVNSSPELSEEWSGVVLWSIRAAYSMWADQDDDDHHVSWMLSKTVPGDVSEATFPWLYILCKLALDHSSTANHVANDDMIRLYAVGAFVAAYQMTSNCLAMSPHPPEPLPVLHQTLAHRLPEVLAVLARYLRVWQTDILRYDSTLADAATPTWAQWMVRLVRAHEMEKQQAQDAQMEHDILQEQQQKKEPARLIARRQAQGRGQEQAGAALGEEGGEHVVEQSNSVVAAPSLSFSNVQDEFLGVMRPIQMTLELVANMTASTDENPDDTMEMNTEDDAAMHDEHGRREADPLTKQVLLQHDIPDLACQLLQELVEVQNRTERANSLPVVSTTLRDLLGKAGTCVSHCLNLYVPSMWCPPSQAPLSFCTRLLEQLSVAAMGTPVGLEGVTSALVVAYHSRPELRSRLDLEKVLYLVSAVKGKDSDPTGITDENVVAVRDLICMLGVLSPSVGGDKTWQKTTTECQLVSAVGSDIERTVCTSLISLLPSSTGTVPFGDINKNVKDAVRAAVIYSEVLNVFMDLFSGDEEQQQQLFAKMQVLPRIQQTVSKLKSCLGTVGATRRTEIQYAQELVEWKETRLNALRFIEYKQVQSGV
jgi:hypothetical protein